MPVFAWLALVGSGIGLWVPIFSCADCVKAIPWLLIVGGGLTLWFSGFRGVVLLLAILVASFDSSAYSKDRLDEYLTGRDILISGIVDDFPRQLPDRQSFPLEVVPNSQLANFPSRILLSWYAPGPPVAAGECWQLKVRLKPPHGFANIAGFDRAIWMFRQHLGAVGYVRASAQNQRCNSNQLLPINWLIRTALVERLETAIAAEPSLPLVLGISLGMRTRITAEQWELLRQTGTSHLMAISGLHVGMVFAACWVLTSMLMRFLLLLAQIKLFSVLATVPIHPLAGFVAACAAFTYSFAAGFALPTVRALIMLLVALLLTQSQRCWRAGSAISIAALAAIFNDPRILIGAGFWLSFGAVMLLVYCGPVSSAGESESDGHETGFPASVRVKIQLGLARMVRAQWVLGVGLVWLTLFFFDQASLLAPLANLIAIPLFSLLILPLIFCGCLLLWLWPGAAALLLLAGCQLLDVLMRLLKFLADALPSVWSPTAISPAAAVLAVLASICLLLPAPLLRGWSGRLTTAALVVSAVLMQHRAPQNGLRIHVIDVGQGLAVVLQAQERALLYDTGPSWRDGNAGEQIVLPVLRQLGIESLDVLVVSHGDSDHSGGVQAVLGEMPVSKVFVSAADTDMHANLHECRMGTAWHWGAIRFEFLHPKNRYGWSDNDASCVLHVQTQGVRILLPGDIERRAEQVVLSRSLQHSVDLVIAPHHGSKTSSSADFVNRLRAKYVVFTTGYANRWGFPAAGVVNRWQQVGSCTINTAQNGALDFAIDAEEGLVLRATGRGHWVQPWVIRQESLCRQ
jgi:competence protein ComEC